MPTLYYERPQELGKIKKTIKYKVMLADGGCMQIMENGERYITGDNDELRTLLGDDVYAYVRDKEIMDAEVTITIIHEE